MALYHYAAERADSMRLYGIKRSPCLQLPSMCAGRQRGLEHSNVPHSNAQRSCNLGVLAAAGLDHDAIHQLVQLMSPVGHFVRACRGSRSSERVENFQT